MLAFRTGAGKRRRRAREPLCLNAGHERHDGVVVKIDIFNHFLPRGWPDRWQTTLPGNIALQAFKRLRALGDIDPHLRLLDQLDAYVQILSLPTPPIELLGSPADTPELARFAN